MDEIKPQKSLVEQTYEILLDAICSGELPPGVRLTQDEIAARLNVSRQPVNSAISILKANHLVEGTGRRGVVVTAIDSDLFQSIYEFRSMVEPFAVRLAAMRLPQGAEDEAQQILATGNAAVRNCDARALLHADIAFHEMIYRWSANPVIENSMRVNWHHIRRSMAETLQDPRAAEPVWQEHALIVQALFDSRHQDAQDHMADHIDKAYKRITARLRAQEV